MHPSVKDLTGQKFGRLVALRDVGQLGKTRNIFWEVRCDCGKVVNVNGAFLTNGTTQSCGCLRRDNSSAMGKKGKTHGQSKSRTYRKWSGMIQRCTNPNVDSYKHYGALGIGVCERWKTFANFLDDMGEAPPGLTLERIEFTKGYSPENCRWATITEQARNKSVTIFVTYKGERRGVAELAEIAELAGVNASAFRSRLRYGWDIDRAMTEPVKVK